MLIVEEMLRKIEKLDRLIDDNLSEIDEINSKLLPCNQSYGIAVQSSHDNDKFTVLISRKIEIEDKINELTDELWSLKDSLIRNMKKINDEKYFEILYERYFEYMSLYSISKEKNTDYSSIKKIHKKALQSLETLYIVVQ